jgi:DNA invertase Pin-like site-specific DNA recombinase
VRQVVSGWKKTANRERIKELISIASSGRYHAVVLFKLDRIGRRVSEVSEYFEKLAENNVLLISVTEGTFDLTDPMGMQFALFLAVQAQGESANTWVRVRRTGRSARRRGPGSAAPRRSAGKSTSTSPPTASASTTGRRTAPSGSASIRPNPSPSGPSPTGCAPSG